MSEPDRFDKMAEALLFDMGLNVEMVQFEGDRDRIAAALRAERASALERAAQAFDDEYLRTGKMHYGYHVAEELRAMSRALIPPAAAPETPRDVPCGACGHPLWWHQWSSKEHRFCSKPLNERDFCRCKNYQEPADAPAAETNRCACGAESLLGVTSIRSADGKTHMRDSCAAGSHRIAPPTAETGKAQGTEAGGCFGQFCPRCPCVVATYQEKCPACGEKMWTPREWIREETT